MLDILARLTAIQQYAKDIHYTAKGDQFYAVHLLVDRVADGLDDFSDSIKETHYLGGGELPPQSKEVLRLAIAYIPVLTDTKADLTRLGSLISSTLDALGETMGNGRADASLLDNIAQDLKLKLGLINRQVA
jgi:DNA-binding ferritin-like protein